MRLPLDNIYITNKHGTSGYGYFGKHAGWDLRAAIGTNVYAKADGVVTERYVGSKGIQVLSIRYSDYEHRYLHLSSMYPTVGSRVKEGQLIARTGNTGGVAAHLHEDIRKIGTSWTASYSNYIDPEVHYARLLNKSSGGEEVFKTDEEVKEAYLLLRGSVGTAAERQAWIGQPKQRFFVVGRPEADSTRQQLAAVKKALADLQAQPPKEIVKVVKEIVEVPVEKITVKEVIVEKEVNPSWLETAIAFIRRVLRIKD